MAYNAGEAFLQIVPSFNNVAKLIDAEAAKWGLSAGKAFSAAFNDAVAKGTNNVRLGPSDSDAAKQGDTKAQKFADAFKARLDAALKNLPDITVDANTSDADAKIAELRQRLTELRDAKIGVDIDEATALAAIADIKEQLERLAAESPDVRVQANTAAAAAELDRLKAQLDEIANDNPDVDVKADTSEADAKLAGTKAAADALGSSSPTITPNVNAGPALAAIAAIKSALLGLSVGGLITPLIGGLAASLGPLAAVGAGFAGIAAAGVPAFAAVTKAEKEQAAAATSGGGAASGAADQIKAAELSLADTERRIANDKITSAEQVKNAQQAVTDAAAQGARSVAQADAAVTSAEQALANAQKASLAAQQALTDAREQGARSLEDQAFAAQDAALNLTQDQLALQEAQANLDAVDKNANSTSLQKQEAALQLQQAQQALVEQQVTLARATEDNTKAQAAGVDGTSAVVSANNAITSAQDKQSAAAAALTKAQQDDAQAKVDAAKKVAQAQQSLADAIRAQQQQAAQDASDLARAQMALAQAEQSAASGGGGAAKATTVLTAEELKLKAALDQLKTKFTDFQTAVDPKVIPVFTGGMKILGDILKPLEPLIDVVAKAITGVEKSVDGAVQGPGFKQFLATLTALAGPAVQSIAGILGNLAGVFAHVVEAAAPLSGVVLTGVRELTSELNKASTGAGLSQFFDTLKAAAPDIVSALSNIGKLVGSLATLFAGLAKPVFDVLSTVSTALTSIVTSVGPAITSLFNSLGPAVSAFVSQLAPIITLFVNALAPALQAIIPSIGVIGQALGQALVALIPALPALAQLVNILVSTLAPVLPNLAAAFTLLVRAIAAIPVGVLQVAVPVIIALFLAFKAYTIVSEAGIVLKLFGAGLASGVLAPIAALAIGAAALFALFHKGSSDTAAITDATAGYTAALQADSGALGEHVRAQAEDNLSKEKAYAAATLLGVSQQTLTDAALGNADAIGQVNAAIQANIDSGSKNVFAIGTVTSALGINQKAIQQSIQDQKDHTAANVGNTAALGQNTTVVNTQKAALDNLNASYKLLQSTTLSMTTTEDAFKQGLLNITAQVKTNGDAINDNTKGGLANKDMLVGLLQQALDTAAAQEKNGASTRTVSAALQENVDKLEAQAIKAGLSKTQVDNLIKSMGIVATIKALPYVGLTGAALVQAELDGIIQRMGTINGAQVVAKIGEITTINQASGGYISGRGTGTSDSIPANLSNGEFVVNAAATAKNLPLLHAINSGMKAMARGGPVSSVADGVGKSYANMAKGGFVPPALSAIYATAQPDGGGALAGSNAAALAYLAEICAYTSELVGVRQIGQANLASAEAIGNLHTVMVGVSS